MQKSIDSNRYSRDLASKLSPTTIDWITFFAFLEELTLANPDFHQSINFIFKFNLFQINKKSRKKV
jgi:hypothetical protein